MSSILIKYFKDNELELSLSYPGINLRRIQQEWDYFKKCRGGQINQFLQLLKSGIPLEYINQNAYFYKSEFFVDQRVLIPRSETEILVEMAVDAIKKNNKKELKVCEVGVGSGAISLSIAKEIREKKLIFTCTDISEKALEVFKINQFLLNYGIAPQHEFYPVIDDRIKKVEDLFDFIFSNPPYIMQKEDFELVHKQVIKYEPSIALFLEDKSYFDWFADFFVMVKERLSLGGVFIMEGHEKHLDFLSEIIEKQGWGSPKIIEDLCKNKRFLRIKKEKENHG